MIKSTFSYINSSSARVEEPGGSFSMGTYVSFFLKATRDHHDISRIHQHESLYGRYRLRRNASEGILLDSADDWYVFVHFATHHAYLSR